MYTILGVNILEFLLVLLIPSSFIVSYSYYKHMMSKMKKQLILSNNQFSRLKSDYRSILNDSSKLSVKFFTPLNKGGITNTRTNLHIAPLDNSSILRKFNMKLEVQILDKATVNNVSWFYVNIPAEDNVNCRGWIKESDFDILYTTSNRLNRPL